MQCELKYRPIAKAAIHAPCS
eukprot:COSAG05_NODE_27084_length_168_cov_67.565217_1_plen_20_part_01